MPATKKTTPKAKGEKPDPSDLQEAPVDRIWIAFKKAGSDQLRNALIEHYLHLVKTTAERMHMRLPGIVDVEDLMSAGLFGLMDAIDAFELDRSVEFETYCKHRIRGAIFDELRAMDWVPRLIGNRNAKVEGARKALETELGRVPTDHELRERLKVLDDSETNIASPSRKWFETNSGEGIREIDVIQQSSPEGALAERQDLKQAMTRLSRTERLIIILSHYEQMTMRDIGMTMDLAESRVQEIHNSILKKLRSAMETTRKSRSTSATRSGGANVRISISDARAKFADVLDRVRVEKCRFVLERHGKPVAALVPMEDFRVMESNQSETKKQVPSGGQGGTS